MGTFDLILGVKMTHLRKNEGSFLRGWVKFRGLTLPGSPSGAQVRDPDQKWLKWLFLAGGIFTLFGGKIQVKNGKMGYVFFIFPYFSGKRALKGFFLRYKKGLFSSMGTSGFLLFEEAQKGQKTPNESQFGVFLGGLIANTMGISEFEGPKNDANCARLGGRVDFYPKKGKNRLDSAGWASAEPWRNSSLPVGISPGPFGAFRLYETFYKWCNL